MKSMDRPDISIIVPTFNEGQRIGRLLDIFVERSDIEVIVSDGGSYDSTPEVCRRYQVKFVGGPKGRGRQQNNGARLASGRIFFFLHADSLVNCEILDEIKKAVDSDYRWGCGRLFFDEPGPFFNLVAWGSRVRAALFSSCYGDQGIFCERSLFFAAGGFPPIPLMEDAAFSRRLRHYSRAHILTGKIITSSRRFREGGPIKTLLKTQLIKALFWLGISPEKLERLYRSGHTGSQNKPAVILMSRAPIPGKTKTRLMPELSGEECAMFHRSCLADILQTIAATGTEPYIYYAGGSEDDIAMSLAAAEVRTGSVIIRPQIGHDLGDRLSNAACEVLANHDRIIFIGADCPEVSLQHLHAALFQLTEHAVVLGPAHDGGYYLLGIKRAHSELFRGIPWGTPEVLQATLKAVEKSNLSVFLLGKIHDIDTWDDLIAFYDRQLSQSSGRKPLNALLTAQEIIGKKQKPLRDKEETAHD